MRTDGGEAVQLTKHEKGIRSYKWSQDESRVFFLADEPRSKEEEKKYAESRGAEGNSRGCPSLHFGGFAT